MYYQLPLYAKKKKKYLYWLKEEADEWLPITGNKKKMKEEKAKRPL